MKLHRIWASALHSWYHLNYSMETWIDLFWFSLIDILVFGLISSFFVETNGQAEALIAGIIMWEVVRIGQYTVTVGMLWEIWSKSFSSLFISPLTLWEFIAGQAVSGIAKSLAVTVMIGLVAKFMFGFNLLQLGLMPLTAYFLVLFLFSVAAGIFVLGLIIRYGTTIQSLAWGLIFMVQPLSAIFYPVEVLPGPLQIVSQFSPVTHIMQTIRAQMATGVIPWQNVLLATVISALYLGLSILFTRWALVQSRLTGAFARMGN